MSTIKSWFRNSWPYLSILVVVFIFFWKFFIKGLVPIPADIITGTYLPWFDLRFAGFPAGIPVKNNVLSDVVSIMYPWRKLAIDLLKSNNLPLWNPYILSGNFLLANFQSAPLYPLNLVYWLSSDFSYAWSIQIIAQPLLAAVFMYIFLKNNKLSNTASFFGSIVWGFSGFFMVWLEYNTIVHAALYFPLILYSIQKGKEDDRFYLLTSLAIGLSFYASYPQITFYELIFSAIFALFVFKWLDFKNYFRILLFTVIGIGLALPMLLPGFEAAGQSIRQVDDVANKSHVKFILPNQIITFVAPDYFGNPTSRNYWLVDGAYENSTIFAGVVAFSLFLISFFVYGDEYRNRIEKPTLLKYAHLVFFISLVLAFENPLSSLLGSSKIFLFSSSVMGRLAVLMMFAIAISSSFVIDGILKNKIKLRSLLTPFEIISFLIAVYGAMAWQDKNVVALRNMILPSLMFLSSSLIIFLLTSDCFVKIGKIKFFRNAFVVTIILLEIFDLFRFHDKYNPFTPKEFLYPKNDLTDFLLKTPDERFEIEDGPIMPSNMWMPYGLSAASGQDAVHTIRYNKFIKFLNSGVFEAGDRYLKVVNYNSPLFDFLGVSKVLIVKWKNSWMDFEGIPSYKFENSKFEKVFDSGRSMILKNTKAFPRIFNIDNYVLAKEDSDFARLLKSEDLRKTVILEIAPEEVFSKADVKIENINFGANTVSFNVNASDNAIIVLTQSYVSGWNAYIDGEKTNIYRADYAFMAIPITSGQHELVIKYEPISFKLGVIGGGISLLFLICSYFFISSKFVFKKNGRG